MLGEEAVCPDGRIVPAVFRVSDFYFNFNSIKSTDITMSVRLCCNGNRTLTKWWDPETDKKTLEYF